MTWRGGALGLLAFTWLVACEPDSKAGRDEQAASGTGGSLGGSAGSASSGHGGLGNAAEPPIDTGSGPDGPWQCTASVPIDLPAVPVRGTITGRAVNGTLCDGGIAAMAQDFTNPDTGEIVTALVFIGPGGTSPRFQFDTPSGVETANLEGRIGIGSGNPEPGTFTNQDSCGSFFFGGGTAGNDILFLYTAAAASNCESPSIIRLGSWSLTIDSLTPVPQDSAGTAYITHGHLLLTVEQSSPVESAEIELEF
ncbi:MAG TPA: hypothetical protein VFV94_15770 [Polyangiaceae bacterium]|nr:hypothetical protein [Polyangiaceae bacterium]